MSNPIVITYDTNPNECSYRFMSTLVNQKWDFKLIGTNKVWKSFLHRAIDYRDELINIHKINSNQLCVISDCRDVLCVRIPNKFNDIFESFNTKIVVSGEMLCAGYTDHRQVDKETLNKSNCTPIEGFWKSKGYELNNLPKRKYANAGLLCGYVSDLIEMYSWIIETGVKNGIYDDQILLGKYLNIYPEKIEVDIDAILLHTSVFGPSAGYMGKYQKYDSPSFAEILGRDAFFIHIPGYSIGKGNKMIYDMISLLIDNGFNNEKFIKQYEYDEDLMSTYIYPED